MEISSILVGIVLFVAALAIVSLPFRQKQRTSLKKQKVDAHSEGRREAVLSALRDLDFDFKTGKVSEEDYTPLRAQLMAEAAHFIEQEKEEEKKLEALVQSRRTTQRQTFNCQHCNAQMEVGQRFCTKCGSAVSQEICSSCGRQNRPGDQFCSACGKRLGVTMEAVIHS